MSSEHTSVIYDFFISYKRADTSNFVEELAAELRKGALTVWLDDDIILPGDSILNSIEEGMRSSLCFILVFSKNYFLGWSEHERRSAFTLMTSANIRIIPIWYELDADDVRKMAPMFADLKAIVVQPSQGDTAAKVCEKIAPVLHTTERRTHLFRLFFRCMLKNFPDDPELKMWVGLLDDNIDQMKEGLEQGADPNLTDTALYNRYAAKAIDAGCFEEWRRLYLYFFEEGSLASQKKREGNS